MKQHIYLFLFFSFLFCQCQKEEETINPNGQEKELQIYLDSQSLTRSAELKHTLQNGDRFALSIYNTEDMKRYESGSITEDQIKPYREREDYIFVEATYQNGQLIPSVPIYLNDEVGYLRILYPCDRSKVTPATFSVPLSEQTEHLQTLIKDISNVKSEIKGELSRTYACLSFRFKVDNFYSGAGNLTMIEIWDDTGYATPAQMYYEFGYEILTSKVFSGGSETIKKTYANGELKLSSGSFTRDEKFFIYPASLSGHSSILHFRFTLDGVQYTYDVPGTHFLSGEVHYYEVTFNSGTTPDVGTLTLRAWVDQKPKNINF